MFAYYNSKVELSDDVVLDIVNLCVKPINTTVIPTLQPPIKRDEY